MKHTSIKIVIVVMIASFLMTNCTKEVSEDLPHEVQTVVLGAISNQTEPIVITIQETVPLRSDTTFSAINDAAVTVYEKDKLGNTQILTNTFTVNNGRYTSATSIATAIGNRYWIEVVFSNGTTIKSEEEELQPLVSILDVNIEDEEVVKIRFSDPQNSTNFYKYTLNLWNEGALVHTRSAESNDVLFDGNANAFVELYRLNDDDDEGEVVVHDTVEVLLCNSNSSSYQFYLRQGAEEEIIQNEDSAIDQFFATPPANLFGNIKNVITGKKVLGNFSVNAISRLRKTVID